VHGVHWHFPCLNLRPLEKPIPKTENNDFVKDPLARAAKYRGPYPYRHGRRLDDSLSFLNVILFSSILILLVARQGSKKCRDN
jgi:hypothetical protein